MKGLTECSFGQDSGSESSRNDRVGCEPNNEESSMERQSTLKLLGGVMRFARQGA